MFHHLLPIVEEVLMYKLGFYCEMSEIVLFMKMFPLKYFHHTIFASYYQQIVLTSYS